MSIYDLALSRRSIRKFQPDAVPDEDIEYFIRTAAAAPSGCNSQCWKFVAVKDPQRIGAMADAVKASIRAFYASSSLPDHPAFLESRVRAATFFRHAPLVIAAAMGHLTYYDERVTQILQDRGYSHRAMMDLYAYPDVLSMGAAIQNMLLAIHERGYGACWMNDPVIVGENLLRLLGVPEGYTLISLIPVGIPRYHPRDKEIKALSEILTIL